MPDKDYIKDILLGVAVGDALGVPVEFISREDIASNPVTSMLAYGTHHQPAGTWSDDSSLTFCLTEMLCKGYDLNDLANRFINWKNYGYWTPHGTVFDIGIATSSAIHLLQQGTPPLLSGGIEEGSNGNGSLMRVLPLVLYIKDMPIAERFQYVKEVSSITHRHIRSIIACFIYIEFALQLLQHCDKHKAYQMMQKSVNDFLQGIKDCPPEELSRFNRLLGYNTGNETDTPLYESGENLVHSSGYVIHTLEAAIWCIFNTNDYKDAVLKAVNLGSDTDTTGAVTGGLAGLIYGSNNIPEEWKNVLSRRDDIDALINKFNGKYN